MPTLNETPSGSRLHISIFGRRNAGKSSLINVLTNQSAAIVSDVPGTTTDPVAKAMEILPLGPVVITDTAGIDDTGDLGALRIEKTLRVIDRTDLAVLVLDPEHTPDQYENDLLGRLRAQNRPIVAVINKMDVVDDARSAWQWAQEHQLPVVHVSAITRQGIDELKRLLITAAPADRLQQSVLDDLVRPGDCAVLVVPIDKAAPAGRLILPQVMTIRDTLDHDAYTLVVKERELKVALANLKTKPKLVVTDSQAVLKAAADTPEDVPFTTFSILMARLKGDLEQLVRGVKAVERLTPGAKVLIAEACTHHRQADDIGKVQIPRWLRQTVGGDIDFHFSSGPEFPPDLASYDLVIHCGGCMINRQEMLSRGMRAEEAGVAMVNYGVFLSYVHGVLERALRPFPAAYLAYTEENNSTGK
ncbi:MAG TPA: [FeFe] hydrogenase H-cluster maturation GTPase HydF [Armatimonadota bacterium]|nr:[FeFe] hydrogenase H-cluster maturation GTPase HydF [Armatimonadota bacterium]